jgi:hypothetical protein
MARLPLPRESLLARRVDAERLAEEREVEQSPEPRAPADDHQPPTDLAHAPTGAVQDAQQIGVGTFTSAEIDHDLRVAEANGHVHATNDPLRASGARAVDNGRRARRRDLLPDFDHRVNVPGEPVAETRRLSSFPT